MKLYLGHITWLHVHAKLEDLLNTSAVSSTSLNKGGYYIKSIIHLGQNKTVKLL